MTPESSRRFTLLDATILIAATAVGLAAGRAAGWTPHVSAWLGGWSRHAVRVIAALRIPWYLLIAWGPTLLALGALPPGGRRGRAWRRPGMAACAALTAALIVQAIPPTIYAATIGTDRAMARGYLPRAEAWIADYAARAAFAVAGAWAALIVAGRWRPDRDWPDRAGRLLGSAWVASYALDQALLISTALAP